MQAYVKDYLITFVRLLLGVDQAPESGHLACVSMQTDCARELKNTSKSANSRGAGTIYVH